MNIDNIKLEIKKIHEKIHEQQMRIFAEDFSLSVLDIDTQMMYIRILYDQYLILQQNCSVQKKEDENKQDTNSIQTMDENSQEDKEEKQTPQITMPSLFDFEETSTEIKKEDNTKNNDQKATQALKSQENVKKEIKLEIEDLTQQKNDNPIKNQEQKMEKEEQAFPIEIDMDNLEFVEEEEEEEEEMKDSTANTFHDNYFPQINPMIDDKEPEIAIPITKAGLQQNRMQMNQFDSISDTYVKEKQELNAQFSSNSENNIASKLQKNQGNDLMKSIDINDKFLFIRELFNGNGSLFTETINHLNQLSKLTDAIEYMEKIKSTYRWKDDSEGYMRLYELILKKYSKQ